jgi:glycosyltransferase involved in cell wall biosynthesis
LLKQSHIFAFPSYYREGIPKSLIEACAVGRPIVTTDSVGCKDCVINGYNGFCIPIKNSRILAEKLEILVNNKQMRVTMGQNSRKLAEREFSVETVVKKHLEIYDVLLEAN